MNEITITIDGKECKAQEGEYILNVARANDIFIPALCYLTRCSPTLACRVCLVEADGKQVYSCNAKSKDGMSITTNTENIKTERRAIMEVYDVNHPLECGVCDQSGECELQNYTMDMKVDNQNYAVKDVHRPAQDWGLMHYDPALCIVCEKCTTTCKDMIGDAVLKTVSRGGDALNAEYKADMPKDAYAMWNKLNKSIIGTISDDGKLDCTNCGECIAVCPVGALVSSDYQYTTNSWELQKIPATCAHCSGGCNLNYEVKHTNTQNADNKIYRVTNEAHYQSLCGAGRFGYDFENKEVSKNEKAFNNAVEAFKKADTIIFNSIITNEEALILQKLKEKFGYALVNSDACVYQKFLNNYSKITSKSLYSADLLEMHASDFVVSIGSAIKTDNPAVRFAFNNAQKINKGAALYFHPIVDPVIDGLSKNIMSINHKVGDEETALYLLLDLFGNKEEMPKSLSEYLTEFHSKKTITLTETIKEKVTQTVKVMKKNEETGIEEEIEETTTKMVPKEVSKEVEVDDNALLSRLNAPDDFNEKLTKFLKKKERFTLVVGEDLYNHKHSSNLATLVAMVELHTPFNVIITPTSTNTLGVALICDLDKKTKGYSVGYNAKADFRLSALGDGDLDMPALNQQEGTITSINKQVLPTNAALPYGGYVLNDIANALGLYEKLTIDYTPLLANNDHFNAVLFDDLSNEFLNDGSDIRGYFLNVLDVNKSSLSLQSLKETQDGSFIYACDPILQFSEFTNASHQINDELAVYLSEQYAQTLGIKENDKVKVSNNLGTIEVSAKIDGKIGGNIAYLPKFIASFKGNSLFDSYRFNQATIEKV
jgi:NADH-quinone oxidoreductase subunit G